MQDDGTGATGVETLDPAAAAGADPSPAAPGADPADAGATPSAEAAAPAPAGVTPEQYAALEERLARFEAFEQALREPDPGYGGYGVPQAEEFVLDPMADPREFTQGVVQLLRQEIAAATGPITGYIEYDRSERGEQRASEYLSGLEGIDGFNPADETGRTLARKLADSIWPDVRQELGRGGPQAAELALRRSAEQVAAFAKAQREAGKQAYIADLARVAGAEGEPAAQGAGAIRQPNYEGMDEVAFARRYQG